MSAALILNFVFDYVNDRNPMLVADAITAYYNQQVTAQPEKAPNADMLFYYWQQIAQAFPEGSNKVTDEALYELFMEICSLKELEMYNQQVTAESAAQGGE